MNNKIIINYTELVLHASPEHNLSEPIEIDGKMYRAEAVQPFASPEAREALRKSMVTINDLFFLEPPRTMEDLKYRVEHYKLGINIQLSLI